MTDADTSADEATGGDAWMEPRQDAGSGQAAPPANPISRRATGVLAAAVSAVPLLIAGVIGIIPQLHGLWPTVAAAAVIAGIVALLGALIVRSARIVFIGQGADVDVVAYRDDRETGILYKGRIENVALRVSTIHLIIDQLTRAIPEDDRQNALYDCGYLVGQSWVGDFHKQLPRLEIARTDILHQLLKWSEYDATAGMGRLTIAVDPKKGEGLVALSNSFLSRSQASFPLNWWFAGYLAGSLTKLLETTVYVALIDQGTAKTSTTFFQVTSTESVAPSGSPMHRIPHPASRPRAQVWISKLKRPLPDEEG